MLKRALQVAVVPVKLTLGVAAAALIIGGATLIVAAVAISDKVDR
jgi:hypothetical protein